MSEAFAGLIHGTACLVSQTPLSCSPSTNETVVPLFETGIPLMRLTVLAKIPAQCFAQQLVILLSTHVHTFQKAPTHTHDLFKSQGLTKHDYFKLNQQLKNCF